MMNWFTKKLKQLSASLNADDEQVDAGDVTTEARPKVGSSVEKGPDNIEELKEIIIGAISQSVRMLGYGNTVVSGIYFHSAFAERSVENTGLISLIRDEEFISRIKRDFKSKGIRYQEDFRVELFTESDKAGKVTQIIPGIGVEVLTPRETLKKVQAKLVATEGITWEPEYILEPTGKYYYIGRCKDPKIENGPKIHNDIAFIGIEEKNEEIYSINNYISRSHAAIVFDSSIGAYKIFRSKFLNNPSHKIKIYNATLNDFSGVSLNQATVPHVLKDGDSITFNDKVVLEFRILS
jgi:hypothetical protein